MKVITIGRSPANDAVIDHPSVSRHHAQLVRHSNGAVTLLDVGSRNGTHVNGRRVSAETALRRGDIVKLGNAVLLWETYFPAPRPAASFPLWLRAAGGIAAAMVVAALALWTLDRQSERDIFFEGEYPPVKTITYTENGETYDIDAISGHVLMYFADHAAHSEAKSLIAQHGGSIIEQMPKYNYYLVEVAEDAENEFIAQMQSSPIVEYAFLNTLSYPLAEIHILDNFSLDKKRNAIHGVEVRKTFENNSSGNLLIYDAEMCIAKINEHAPIYFNRIHSTIKSIMENTNNNEIVLINVSLGPGLFDAKGRHEDENGRKISYLGVPEKNINNYIKQQIEFLKAFAEAFESIEKNGKTNFIVTNSSGNSGFPNLDELVLNKLGAENISILERHFLFVNAYDEKDLFYSNQINNKHSIAAIVDISEEAFSGTSFAAPKLLGWVDRIANQYHCLNVQDILQIIRMASEPNPREPLVYAKLEREAKRMVSSKRCDQENENEYYYEPSVSVIEGMINIETFDLEHLESEVYTGEYGKESLTVNHRTAKDGEERYGVIYLDKPINIICNADCEEFYELGNVSVYNISKIQLAGTWSSYQGKKVRLTGTFGYGITRHYYTNGVIMWVEKIELMDDESAEKPKSETKNTLIGTKWKWESEIDRYFGSFGYATLEFKSDGTAILYNYRYDGFYDRASESSENYNFSDHYKQNIPNGKRINLTKVQNSITYISSSYVYYESLNEIWRDDYGEGLNCAICTVFKRIQ